jgi:hypothetical protein
MAFDGDVYVCASVSATGVRCSVACRSLAVPANPSDGSQYRRGSEKMLD